MARRVVLRPRASGGTAAAGLSIVNAFIAASISASMPSSATPGGAGRPRRAGSDARRVLRPSKKDFSFVDVEVAGTKVPALPVLALPGAVLPVPALAAGGG